MNASPSADNPPAFASKSCLIAGASGNVGLACVQALLSAGACVYALVRDPLKMKAAVESLPAGDTLETSRLHILSADFSQPIPDALLKDLPLMDGFVYAAGLCDILPVKFQKPERLLKTLMINLVAPADLSRLLLSQKKLRTGSSMLFISSIASETATIGHSAYSASKAGLEAFARVLALEAAPAGVRVNCIQPGMLASDMQASAGGHLGNASLDSYLASYPLGVGRPHDIARLVLFMLSTDARWFTGSTLKIDGGITLKT